MDKKDNCFVCTGIFKKENWHCCFFDGGISIYDDEIEFHWMINVVWKPHEYRQEARESCLITYWIFKNFLGRDIAGIIAKFVWSTRFDFCWEK